MQSKPDNIQQKDWKDAIKYKLLSKKEEFIAGKIADAASIE